MRVRKVRTTTKEAIIVKQKYPSLRLINQWKELVEINASRVPDTKNRQAPVISSSETGRPKILLLWFLG